jgi:hypothetical protein
MRYENIPFEYTKIARRGILSKKCHYYIKPFSLRYYYILVKII